MTENATSGDERGSLNALCERLGYQFADRSLLTLALTHRSWVAENEGRSSNERLEFLGDAVLGLSIADCLFIDRPDSPEGELAKIRSGVVSGASLACVARSLGLGEYLHLGRGEETTGGRDKASILADALEAVFGAVYVDAGMATAKTLIVRLLGTMVEEAGDNPGLSDHKTMLQELAAQKSLTVPQYSVTAEGPDHAKIFHASVVLGTRVAGEGSGPTKKEAEQASARAALKTL